MSKTIRLTEYRHDAGCGCRIAPADFAVFLQSNLEPAAHSLLVDNGSRDDTAVYDLGNGTGVVSTTKLFIPIVDDAFDFGRVAAANAISDRYAMGETSIAVFGWPIKKHPQTQAAKLLKGAARSTFKPTPHLEAGTGPLAGLT